MKITDASFLFGPRTKGLHETTLVPDVNAPAVAAPAVTETTTQQIPGGVQETTVSVAPGRMTSAQMIAQDKAEHPIPLASRWNKTREAQQFKRDLYRARQYENNIRKMSFALGTTDPKQMEERLGLMMFAKGMKQAGVPMSDITQALNIQRQLAPQPPQVPKSAFTATQILDALQRQDKVATELFAQRNPILQGYLVPPQAAAEDYGIGHKEFEMGNKYIKAAIHENIRNSRAYDGLLRAFMNAATGEHDMHMLTDDPVLTSAAPGPIPQFLVNKLEGRAIDWGNAPTISPDESIIPTILSGGWMQPASAPPVQNLQRAEQLIRMLRGRN